MKYRIIQRVDGKFEVQYKKNIISDWTGYYRSPHETLGEAQEDLDYLIKDYKEKLETENGKKIYQIVKGIEI